MTPRKEEKVDTPTDRMNQSFLRSMNGRSSITVHCNYTNDIQSLISNIQLPLYIMQNQGYLWARIVCPLYQSIHVSQLENSVITFCNRSTPFQKARHVHTSDRPPLMTIAMVMHVSRFIFLQVLYKLENICI